MKIDRTGSFWGFILYNLILLLILSSHGIGQAQSNAPTLPYFSYENPDFSGVAFKPTSYSISNVETRNLGNAIDNGDTSYIDESTGAEISLYFGEGSVMYGGFPAIIKNGTLRICVEAYTEYHSQITLYWSKDGGITWGNTFLLPSDENIYAFFNVPMEAQDLSLVQFKVGLEGPQENDQLGNGCYLILYDIVFQERVDTGIPPGTLVWSKDIIYMGNMQIAEINAKSTQVTLTDRLGSPRFAVLSDGTVVRQKFGPFGEILPDNINSQSEFAKGFTGHEQTDASGLIYMQARFYLPMYGRFASPDPARDQHFEQTQSWNIYSYVQNNPVTNTDPTGLSLWDSIKGAANGWTNSNFGVELFSANDSKDYRDAVVAGDVAAMLQSGHEMAAGAAAISGGGGVTILSGGTLAEVGVPVAVGGVALAAHGAVVGGRAIANLNKDLPAALNAKDSPSGPKADQAPGTTSSGQATDKYGNKLGGSGKPEVHTVEHSTQKGAKDAGRQQGNGKPVKHPSPKNPKQKPHFHPTKGGEKIPNSTHHEF